MPLAAIACMSLAAKLEEANVPDDMSNLRVISAVQTTSDLNDVSAWALKRAALHAHQSVTNMCVSMALLECGADHRAVCNLISPVLFMQECCEQPSGKPAL